MNISENNLPSNAIFGFFMASISLLEALNLIYIKKFFFVGCIFVFFSIYFLTLAIFKPNALKPLNIFWKKLGLFLGSFFGPIFLGVLFFCFITPIAIFMRIFGRDELQLKKLTKNTYWKKKSYMNSQSNSFKDQF